MEKLTNDYYSRVKAQFTSYIGIVIKNASINFKKKQQTLQFIESEYTDKVIKDISLSLNGDVSFFDSFEKHYSYEQLENYFSNYYIYSSVKKSPIQQKQILYYRIIKNYSYKRIALFFNTSEANIRNIKSRAIKNIKNNIKENEYNER